MTFAFSSQPLKSLSRVSLKSTTVVTVVLATVAACGGGSEGFVDRSQLAYLVPKVTCSSLSGMRIPSADIALPTTGATVTSAKLVSAVGETVSATSVRHATPEYCEVFGEILPVDSSSFPIRFQLNVPTSWNQKTIQIGGGGLNGSIPGNLSIVGTSGSPISAAFPPDSEYPISRGYAHFASDSGHQNSTNTATWALNDEAWTNFGHAGLKKTHDAAFAVIQALYGSRPVVSYFMGQSQGGREAMEVAQRYPDDYDGIVATAPLMGYTAHVVHKALLAPVQTGAGWIAPAKAVAIGMEVSRQCDSLDGIADGIVSNYRACAALFDPRRQPYQAIRCPDGADTATTCVSDPQIATLHQMHTPTSLGFELSNGLSVFPGYGVGREELGGWLNLNPQPNLTSQPMLGQPGATLLYGILKDPGFNLSNFSIAPFKDKIQAASAIIDSTNANLSRFFARGGRMIIKNSPADYSSNPQTVMRYYDTLVDQFGQALIDAHVRYYVLPYSSHSGDVGVNSMGETQPQFIDLTRMATDWVEKDVMPPDAPIVSAKGKVPPYVSTGTRPMCRYPLYPHYNGTGDRQIAASYSCLR